MKRIFLAAFSAALLMSSCDTTAPLISIPAENVDQLPLKVSDLSEDQLKDWPAKDIQEDTIPGMSVEKTYDELIKEKGASVIVAVVDSGVDIEHEDLKAVIWTNTDEIPGNGIDDDKNGYIDDVHGWNFLGDIVQEQLEKSRIVQKYDAQFKGKTLEQIPSAQKEVFKTYTKAKKEVETEKEELIQQKTQYEQILAAVKSAHTAVSQKLGKEDYTAEEVEALEAATDMEQRNQAILTQMLNYEDTIPEFITMIGEQLESMADRLNNNYNLNGNYRAALGDNPDDIKDTNYGNNNVIGPDPESAMHGTHVAGIIAAERDNGVGMNGVANNVQIMSVRAVPDGDERDKDIALAIRYAVDNGAKVINTSFGKYFATNPEWVYDAIKYAAKKDVLIVNAAGNEGVDLDNGDTVYPNDQLDNVTEFADNVISVGALNDIYGGKLVASFSNYGKSNVDVFAPGVQIWSTVPGNEYRFLQGTSMAAPEVAGVAAMLRSYYPQFSAAQIKQIIMQTGVSTNIQVAAGGDAENVKSFSSLSKSGKMVNMYNAFKMAELSSKN
ncbi:S8 family peptidase [Leeuwenhoekiella polynyae]|uniref:Subtilase family protein n=1 Tax=Leeuwenhoekiella polynyae TaxID=1550906 RepID=A0A4Q0PIM4_9FLAO|nr:S8 family peptidase [Leeuwenhoekiella polynyae]RXG26448.1 subtilase family protein [Leeuwenhoekiella polynyae]